MAKGQGEDELLLEAIASQRPGTFQWVIFGINALLVAAVPSYLYVTIYGMDLATYFPVYAIVTLVAAVGITYAYQRQFTPVKGRLESKDNGNTSQAIKDFAKKQNVTIEVAKSTLAAQASASAANQALAYSIIASNLLFLFLVVFLNAFILLDGVYNYVLTVPLAALGVALLHSKA